jgi:hypothetical protein
VGSDLPADEFDVFAFVEQKRAGRKIKRPKKIVSQTDERGLITLWNETQRPCIDDRLAMRVVLVADLRRSHPKLKPGVLGRTVPNTSDYYRYAVVQFDNGVTEAVSISAVQPVVDKAAEAFAKVLRKSIIGSRFDWDDEVAWRQIHKWEDETYRGRLDISKTIRSGSGPHELYAYTFPSLIALASLRKEKVFPVKIGYTGVAYELAPSLTRIDGQLGDSASRFEAATVLGVWNTRNGRTLESKVHKHFRDKGRRVKSAIGQEWFLTNTQELRRLVEKYGPSIKPSGVPINGPSPALQQASDPPCKVWAQSMQVLCCGINPNGLVYLKPIEFDDLLEEAATPDVQENRVRLAQES